MEGSVLLLACDSAAFIWLTTLSVLATWLRAFASVVVGILILLSLTLTITTLFPGIDVGALAVVGGIVLAVVLAFMGLRGLRSIRGAHAVTVIHDRPDIPKEQWTMSPLTLLSRPRWSGGRRVAMLVLGSYMLVALVLLIVKSVQLAGG